MSTTILRTLSSATLFVFAAALCSAQNIAPAHSGTIHYFEGDVTVDGVKLVSQVARFTDLKEQSVLHTGLGRAEILLTPGVILRVGENTSVKMLDNRLVNTRVEFLSGTAMLESDDSQSTIKDPAVTIIYKDFQAQPLREGLFELNSQPGQVRVFKGEARVDGNGATVNVKEGNLIDLSTTMASVKFNAKEADELYLWSRDRSAYLSAGNMSSARTLAASGYGNSSMGYGGLGYGGLGMGYSGLGMGYGGMATGWNPAMWSGFSGGWYYNPYLGMYSYMPFAGTIDSPFGNPYFNPATIGYAYAPGGYYWTGAGGARTGAISGVPLSTLPRSGSSLRSSNPLLPRLGVTAAMRPTLSAPIRGMEPRMPSSAFSPRNMGLNSPVQSGLSSSGGSVGRAISAPASAPVARGAPAGRGR